MRRRASRTATLVAWACAALVLGCRSAGAPAVPGAMLNVGASGQPIAGAVVDFDTHRPLAGRTVQIGFDSAAARATTDAAGRFVLGHAPARYDLMIADADAAVFSIYLGVERRDPLVAHRSSPAREPLARSAQLWGTVAGGGEFPLYRIDSVAIAAVTPHVAATWFMGGDSRLASAGPGFGPIHLAWSGPASLSGRVMALGRFDGTHWFGQQTLNVHDGGGATVDIDLAAVGTVRLTGRVAGAEGIDFFQASHLDPTGAALVLGDVPHHLQSQTFELVVADLAAAGGALCITVGSISGRAFARRCGLGADSRDLALTVQTAPTLHAPRADDVLTPETRFAWSAAPNTVHVLSLEPDGTPTRERPALHVHTAAATAAWPSGTAAPPPPWGAGAYSCTVAALGPFADVDAAVAPGGLGAPLARELRWSVTSAIALHLAPAPRTDARR